MECTICFDAITRETGSTALSCEHSFHLRCIVNWFGKQLLDGLEQSCPCCRNMGTDMDRIEVLSVHDDEEEDEDFVDAESETISEGGEESEMRWWESMMTDFRWERQSTGQWLITSNQHMAFDSLRALFGSLNELEAEESPEEAAARKIQAILRGHLTRRRVDAATTLASLT